MAERKPASESWDSWIDRAIRDAEERGEFDDLPGAGRPIPDLGREYDEAWWVKSLLRREELSILPDTLQLQLFAERGRERIMRMRTEDEVRRALAELNEEIAARLRTAVTGPASRTTLVDVERFVARWRRRSGAPDR